MNQLNNQSILPFVNLSLAEKDKHYINIHYMIDIKEKLLTEKHKTVKLSEGNEFLDDVREDYNKYYKYIVKQKQEQIQALQLLNKYIKDLKKSGELSKRNREDAKREQEKIMNELESIKNNIDNLIEQ